MTNSQPSNFIPVSGDPLSTFVRANYPALHAEFFNMWMPNITRPKLMFTWDNGMRPYENKIMSAALKISDQLLDSKEREGMRQIMPVGSAHLYPVRDLKPEVWDAVPTWRRLVNAFDDVLEALTVNVAYPGSSITKHTGVDNHCYRTHLCLQNNSGFTFHIGDESRPWIEGPDGMFKFDDGNILHSVGYTDRGEPQPRVVVLFDVLKEFYV